MQSFNIKWLAKWSDWVVTSAILIDCPTAAAATAILSGYFVFTVLTDCFVFTVLDLYRC